MTAWRALVGVPLEGTAFEVRENELYVAGAPAARWMAGPDAGPVYLYDGLSITHRARRLRDALPPSVGLKYAVKANPFPPLLGFLQGLVDGFDVASAAEMATVLGLGVAPSRISLAGPGKPEALLTEAVDQGVVVSAESPREVRLLSQIGRRLQKRPRALLRINPSFGLRGSGMHMSGTGSPFGVDCEAAADVLVDLPPEIDFLGLHVFCGSQCLSDDALMEAHRRTFELAAELADVGDFELRYLNIGAGFGIPYFSGDEAIDLEQVAAGFTECAAALKAAHPNVRIELELGRYLVGEAGLYLCRVIDKKRSRGKAFLITNGGMHHHLAASGNLGQIVKRNYPVCLANRMEAGQREKVTVVGPLCTPLDVLARDVELPVAQIGDLVAVLQSGAYGLSASPIGFLGHPPAREVLIES